MTQTGSVLNFPIISGCRGKRKKHSRGLWKATKRPLPILFCWLCHLDGPYFVATPRRRKTKRAYLHVPTDFQKLAPARQPGTPKPSPSEGNLLPTLI